MALKIITTEDGSHSLLDDQLNETYHSTRGARGESYHVFIRNGLDYFHNKYNPSQVKILEIGMGTGLNVFLTAKYAAEKKISVAFTTLEPFPVAEDIYQHLNYAEGKSEEQLFTSIHESEWGKKIEISPFFHLIKQKTRVEDYRTEEKFQVVYYDAFAPSKQAEIWSVDNLSKCFDLLEEHGLLTTYCAQGQFKRNLKEVGFMIETLQGALGKKEMVLALKE